MDRMRMGVLDIGSNTGHLLVVDAFRGGPPIAAHSYKEPLRLAEQLDADHAVTPEGVSRLVKYVVEARSEAEDKGCTTILAFATSAVRDAVNVDAVIAAVNDASGLDLQVLAGPDEARLTFLAVRRWFGWSAGRLGVFDIGGGSLEIAVGADESPEIAQSMPLGAGRLTREWLDAGRTTAELRLFVRSKIADEAGAILRGGAFDRAVATSKTFRSLARICGAAPSSEGQYVRRVGSPPPRPRSSSGRTGAARRSCVRRRATRGSGAQRPGASTARSRATRRRRRRSRAIRRRCRRRRGGRRTSRTSAGRRGTSDAPRRVRRAPAGRARSRR